MGEFGIGTNAITRAVVHYFVLFTTEPLAQVADARIKSGCSFYSGQSKIGGLFAFWGKIGLVNPTVGILAINFAEYTVATDEFPFKDGQKEFFAKHLKIEGDVMATMKLTQIGKKLQG